MRVIYIYILSFCLLLFGGYRYAHGNSVATGSSAYHIEKVPQVRSTAALHNDVINTATAADEKLSIISVENEDDDASSVARKFVLLAGSLIVLVYAAFLVACFKPIKTGLYTYRQLLAFGPGKYLALSSLRI